MIINLFKKVIFPVLLITVASSSFYYNDVVAEDLNGQCPEINTTFFSDTTTKLSDGSAAVAAYDEHPLWTANIPGATWVWSSYYVEDPLVVDTRTFVKTFDISNTQSIVNASITLAADNTYKLFANGTLVGQDLTEFNYYDENKKTFDLKPFLQTGSNTLTFEITNLTNPLAPTQDRNPAGLLYRFDLTTKENNCNGGGPVNTPPTITLIGANPATTTVGAVFVDPGATAHDQEDGNITDKIVTSNPVNTAFSGTYTIQYSVTDSKGLSAATTRDVIVYPVTSPIKQCTIEIVSDPTTQVWGSGFSQQAYSDHEYWTANIPGATWIWKTFFVADSTVDDEQTFERTFNIAPTTSTIDSATLLVAADNSYTLSMNGVPLGGDSTEFNYRQDSIDTYNVTSFINKDLNRINFTVKNWAVASSTPTTNPAGLLYKLTIKVSGAGEDCSNPINHPPVITLIGNNPMNITVGSQFVDPGATAQDQEDGNITANIVKSGSVNTVVAGTYIINYSVTDSGGLSAATSRVVKVTPVSIPTPTISLSANPSSIVNGNSSTLTWTSTNTNYCSAAWTTATSTSGTQVVSPTSNTEYSISCGGNYGTTTATTSVTVTTNSGGGGTTPTISLSANPQAITAGATSTLTWSSTHMISCSAPWTTATSTSGTQIVSPATTTEYAITCTGNYGTKTASTTITVTPVSIPTPTISLSANPSSIVNGNSSTLTWTSTNTNYCSAAWTTATSTSGTQVVSPTSNTEYSISCGGNYGTTTATTTVTISTPSGGGGGGGGGGGDGGGSSIGGRRRDISNLLAPQGEILGATSCAYLRDYLKIGWNNDPIEMLKLKSFLNVFERENLSLTTVFDRPTFDAVSRFQNKYFNDILEPWGHKAPTGFVYILTKKKINEIYCNTEIILNQADRQEIAAFRALMDSYNTLSRTNYQGGVATSADLQATLTKALEEFEQNGSVVVQLKDNSSTTSTSTPSSIVKNAAVSLFSLPETIADNLEYVAIFILAIIGASLITRTLTKNPAPIDSAPVANQTRSPFIILPAKDTNKKNDANINASVENEIVIDDGDEIEGEIKVKD